MDFSLPARRVAPRFGPPPRWDLGFQISNFKFKVTLPLNPGTSNEAGLHLITSNRLETLAAKLVGRLRRPLSSPLEPEIVVVRNQGMERWLKLGLAERHGICANYRFHFPEAFAHKLF